MWNKHSKVSLLPGLLNRWCLLTTGGSNRKKRPAAGRVGRVQRRLPGSDQHPHRERPGRVRMLRCHSMSYVLESAWGGEGLYFV